MLKYQNNLCYSENLSIFPIDVSVADRAVMLRAEYRFKTPDAIQIATALASWADIVNTITNDKQWKKIKEAPWFW